MSGPALLSTAAGFGAALLIGMRLATAQTAPDPAPAAAAPAERQTPVPAQTGTGTGAAKTAGILQRDKVLGTLGGVRTKLEEYGVTLGLTEASEVLGNVTGGRATGLVYEGLTTASLDFDLEKSIGLSGGTARVSALQIHGRGLSSNYVDNLNVTSSIEATRATRLFEFWYQQSFLGGRVDVRLGQQSADLEFATSSYAGLFINSSFGWPTSSAVNLPAGGPAYPLATLGARLRVKPIDPVTVLLGVFNGSPSGIGTGDPQGRRNSSGTAFRLNDGVFVIGEAQYATNKGEGATGLPGTYKLGAWYNSNAFTNQFFTGSAVGAAAPGAISPRSAQGDWSIYAVADQLVWRAADVKDGGVGVFARAAGSPGDRNLIDVFVDAGVTYNGIFGRDNDTLGLGVGLARISDTPRAADRATRLLTGVYTPTRSSEVILELTYQAQLIPSVQVQPVFQYVVRPRGGVPNPDHPERRLGDAAILGVRSTLTF